MTLRVGFLGYVATEDQVLAAATLSLADNRMQRAYIGALEREFGDVETFSSVDPSLGSGRVRRYTRLLGRIRSWARERSDSPTVLTYYNTFLIHALIGRILQVRYGVRIVPITITLPYGFEAKPTLRNRLENRLSRRILARVDGVVAISPFLVDEVAPGAPALIVRGGVPQSDLVDLVGRGERGQRVGPTRIVYAGTLYDRYHLHDAVAMMEHLGDKFRLDIFGRGPLVDLVEQAASRDDRIRYHGVVSQDVVRAALAEADIALVLLDPSDHLARNSFPSKVFESLSSGAAVVISDLPTLDDAMRSVLNVVTDLSPEDLAHAVRDIGERTPEDVAESAERSLAYLREHGTWEAVGKHVRTFLVSLT